ncbi:secreted RxLR effector protein 161-like [Diospyros lotus]|uniref:secreted RxLR effector protein 161-like n=1 Tax=Diospyros lotus TaxID=55363 RepID=UPI002257408E|nr:secreted RxLR effector protein 161-like [Diospyros lotus]
MEDSKRGLLPFRHGIHLSRDMCPKTQEERDRMSRIPYASAIGSLMYAMLCTRPDIAHAVSVTSRYQSNPGEQHWIAVKNILKYLRRTKDLILTYGTGELKVEGYTDSDFQSDIDDRKSISGYVFTCNGGVFSWKSSKQDTTADSTTEAEYIAASDAAKEAVWIKKFVTELGVLDIEDLNKRKLHIKDLNGDIFWFLNYDFRNYEKMGQCMHVLDLYRKSLLYRDNEHGNAAPNPQNKEPPNLQMKEKATT